MVWISMTVWGRVNCQAPKGNIVKLRLAASILIVFLVGCDQITSPKNYDDCILNNMKGVDSDLGASQIRQSCRKKYPITTT